MSTIALALNRLDTDLEHGNVVAARSVSAELRGELAALARMFGLT
jgi:hypothetical protein